MEREVNVFTIDVASEIRKLVDRRHTTAWEPFVELIRLAAEFGAADIDVTLSRSQFALRARGAHPNEGVFFSAFEVFDEALPAERRHRALSDLEGRFGLGILSAFSGKPKRVNVVWRRDGEARGISFSPARRPKKFTPKHPADFKIEIWGRGAGAQARRIVENRCMHADVPITINGARISRGKHLETCLLSATMEHRDIRGIAGIPASGDVTRITRLRHGIVDEEVVFPAVRGLVTSAVVEDSLDDIHAVNGALRKVGRELYRKLVAHWRELSSSRRKRAETLLFDRYEHTRDTALLEGVDAFPVLGGEPIDFAEVRRRLKNGDVLAIGADTPPALYTHEGRCVLVLDTAKRRFLESALNVTLMTPPRKAYFSSVRERLVSFSRQWRRRLRRQMKPTGPPVPDHDLTDAERRFLVSLRGAMRTGQLTLLSEPAAGSVEIVMSEKGPLPWTRVNGRAKRVQYRIPRHHSVVRAMVRAHAGSPRYLYPAVVVLTEGQEIEWRAT